MKMLLLSLLLTLQKNQYVGFFWRCSYGEIFLYYLGQQLVGFSWHILYACHCPHTENASLLRVPPPTLFRKTHLGISCTPETTLFFQQCSFSELFRIPCSEDFSVRHLIGGASLGNLKEWFSQRLYCLSSLRSEHIVFQISWSYNTYDSL